MRTQRNLLYTLVAGDFFESIDRYPYDDTAFASTIRNLLPPNWHAAREGVWFHCVAPNHDVPEQGWKLHLSATNDNAIDILTVVVPIFVDKNVSFKCAADKRLLALMTGKNWNRGGSGKFITVYPSSTNQFLELAEHLYAATREFTGPYILSDNRYLDSKVLFYRFGTMSHQGAIDVRGQALSLLRAPNGSMTPDIRSPFFQVPEFEVDPVAEHFGLPHSDTDAEEPQTLKHGRYKIDRVLGFSNSGGVYVGTDRSSGKEVLIKEARPRTNKVNSSEDAISLLRKEHRLLTKLSATGISPMPLDLFQDWEHLFLVEEYCEGINLSALSPRSSLLLKTQWSDDDAADYFAHYCRLFQQISSAIEIIHQHGIVFCDLSPNNVLVLADDVVKIVDYEAACELGVDSFANMSTPGFSPRKAMAEGPLFTDDYYALGAMMLSYLFPVTAFLQLEPEATARLVESVCYDARIPNAVQRAILSLLSHSREARPAPAVVRSVLEAGDPSKELRQDGVLPLRDLLAKAKHYITSHATPERTDRLFPPDYRLFSTNPLSLAYGACGTLCALKSGESVIPPELILWILEMRIDKFLYPPGLGVGLSGIAWCLLELGQTNRAKEVLEMASSHPGLTSSTDLFYGLAGYGMTNLRFFFATRDEKYLQRAIEVAHILRKLAHTDDDKAFWPDIEGKTHLGLMHGASGISIFLLYLFLITKDPSHLQLGQAALDFDVSHGIDTPTGGLTWPYRTDYATIVLPYWAYGSAGVGAALLRYQAFLGVEKYSDSLVRAREDATRKFTVSTGKMMGLAGILGFHLDCAQLLDLDDARQAALTALDGIRLYTITRPEGIAFPGDMQNKISCDYGYGMAGVVMAIERITSDIPSEFMLDEFFARNRQLQTITQLGTR